MTTPLEFRFSIPNGARIVPWTDHVQLHVPAESAVAVLSNLIGDLAVERDRLLERARATESSSEPSFAGYEERLRRHVAAPSPLRTVEIPSMTSRSAFDFDPPPAADRILAHDALAPERVEAQAADALERRKPSTLPAPPSDLATAEAPAPAEAPAAVVYRSTPPAEKPPEVVYRSSPPGTPPVLPRDAQGYVRMYTSRPPPPLPAGAPSAHPPALPPASVPPASGSGTVTRAVPAMPPPTPSNVLYTSEPPAPHISSTPKDLVLPNEPGKPAYDPNTGRFVEVTAPDAEDGPRPEGEDERATHVEAPEDAPATPASSGTTPDAS